MVTTLNNNELNTLKLLFGYEELYIKNGKDDYIELSVNKIDKKIDIKRKNKNKFRFRNNSKANYNWRRSK